MRIALLLLSSLLIELLFSGAAAAESAVREIARPIYIGGKTAQDQQTATEISKLVRSFVEASKFSGNEFAVGASGGLKGYRLHIYGVTDPHQQDRIVQIIKDNAVKNAWKPIYICFVEKQVLVREGNGYQKWPDKTEQRDKWKFRACCRVGHDLAKRSFRW